MCNNPIYKPREEEEDDEAAGGGGGEAAELLRGGGERFSHAAAAGAAQEAGTNYRTLLEKEQEWSLAVSSSQLNTIVAVHPQHPAGGGLAAGPGAPGGVAAGGCGGGGGGGGGGGAPRDRERPPCAVGFVDCLYGTVPKLKELHVHPPGMQYPDLQQDARLKETLLFAAGKGFSDHQTPTSEYLELRAKLQTKPDYLEVLEKTTYRF
ncbi:hypothetical protein ASZ78_012334 [Callipepla squamata]|uniref:Uncharacterized protein n=1 Tax=Callipepla squamata TaxID=9009 RepID=A0A226N3V1_CALSU|nr:hypothetical protein ASZ78_012334 [Callipepla squamata]